MGHTHDDPSRIPHLQLPIEEEMLDLHEVGIKKVLIDVTKLLVQSKKKK